MTSEIATHLFPGWLCLKYGIASSITDVVLIRKSFGRLYSQAIHENGVCQTGLSSL
jgi:hypothetical protein